MSTLALGCGGSDLLLPADSRPAALAIVQGNNQSAQVGEPLPQPIAVRVTDGAGRPVAQARVTFAVSGGGATISPAAAMTDLDGRASAEWSLGMAAGAYTAEARVDGSTIEPARFTAFAAAGVAARIELIRGDGQTAPVGTPLPDSLIVAATDAAGNAVEGIGITWSVTGGGSVSVGATATGADGRAGVVRILGPTAGAQTTLAAVAGVTGSPVTFTATATSGTAGKLRVVTQPSASARISTPFSRQPQVQLIDNLNNEVRQAGRAITAGIATGPAGATLTGQRTRETDATGLASFTDLGIAGPAGTYTLSFAGADLALATSASIVVTSGDVSASRSRVDAEPESFLVVVGKSVLTVTLVDQLGNAVGGTSVTPTVDRSEAAFQPSSAVTDETGRATFTLTASRALRYIVGARVGSGSLQARDTVTAERIPTVISLTADPPSPTRALQPLRVSWSVSGTSGILPTGNVSVEAGATSCSAAVAQGGCTVTPLIAGGLDISATYAGDVTYLPSAATLEHQVDPVPTSVTSFSSDRPTAASGEWVTLDARVAAEASSLGGTTLTFSRDACGPGGTALATRTVTSSGAATWSSKNLPLGTYSIFACYNGNATFAPSQAGPITQTVSSRR